MMLANRKQKTPVYVKPVISLCSDKPPLNVLHTLKHRHLDTTAILQRGGEKLQSFSSLLAGVRLVITPFLFHRLSSVQLTCWRDQPSLPSPKWKLNTPERKPTGFHISQKSGSVGLFLDYIPLRRISDWSLISIVVSCLMFPLFCLLG